MQLQGYSTFKHSPVWLLHCDSCQHCHLFCLSDLAALQSTDMNSMSAGPVSSHSQVT